MEVYKHTFKVQFEVELVSRHKHYPREVIEDCAQFEWSGELSAMDTGHAVLTELVSKRLVPEEELKEVGDE